MNEGSSISGTWSQSPGADGLQEITFSINGGDSQTVTSAAFGSSNPLSAAGGTITFHQNGTWIFNSPAGSIAANQSFTFTVAVKDGDGDTASSSEVIEVINSSSPTTTSPSVVADEDDLTAPPALFAGIGDTTSPGDDDAPAGLSGSLGSYGPDGAGLTGGVTFPGLHGGNIEDSNGAPVQRDGVNLQYFWDGANNTLYGTTNTTNATLAGANASFKVVVDQSDASYDFTLLKHVDHEPGDDENDIDLEIGYTITDDNGDSANGTLAVKIDDDMPVTQDNDYEAHLGSQNKVDLLLVVDVSGSMDTPSGHGPDAAPVGSGCARTAHWQSQCR